MSNHGLYSRRFYNRNGSDCSKCQFLIIKIIHYWLSLFLDAETISKLFEKVKALAKKLFVCIVMSKLQLFQPSLTKLFQYLILVVKGLFSNLHVQVIMNLEQSIVKMVLLRNLYLFIYARKAHNILLARRNEKNIFNVFNSQLLLYKKINFTITFIRKIIKLTHHQLYWIRIWLFYH